MTDGERFRDWITQVHNNMEYLHQILTQVDHHHELPTSHGTICTGKTGKMAKQNPCQGKHREFGNFAKTQGILFDQVINSLIFQKVKDIAIFAAYIVHAIATNHVN